MSETHCPFMFNFREAVSGNGFLAGVTISGGRSLMLKEDGEWWMYGVRPAGLAETGATPLETFLRFMERLKAVLFDIASETKSYEEFKASTERFLQEACEIEEKRWNAAQQLLKTGEIEPDPAFLASFPELPKESPELRPTSMGVVRLDGKSDKENRFSPSDNVTHTQLFMAA